MRFLNRIKEKIKKIATQKIEIKGKPKAFKKAKKEDAREMPKEVLGATEMTVGQAKFSTPEMPRFIPKIREELPRGYGYDKIVLQVRDARWIHAYWEVTFQTIDKLKDSLRHDFFGSKRVLRIYDVSNIIFDGTNAHNYFDIEVRDDATNWYVDTNGPGRTWCADIGLLLANGKFITIARSNTVQTPLEGPSWITDEEWMIPEDMFARLYGMGFGFGKSSPIGKAWQERIKQALFSGAIASGGISPVKKQVKERNFWLLVNTELIVYGATEPDAKVRVQGRKINLRPDGTFSLRFALPDGKQVIPVEATSSDGLETKTITPVVSKETK